MKTAAVILAAGKASRFGSPKQLLEIEGLNLVQRAAQLAASVHCTPIIIVTGAYHEELKNFEFPENTILIQNPEWEKGMGSSLAKGITYLTESTPHTEASYILLADQPAIRLETLISLSETLNPPHVSIVLSDAGKSKGPPSLFHAQHFPELTKLHHDSGAKTLVQNNLALTATIAAPEASWDIDEQDRWQAYQKQL